MAIFQSGRDDTPAPTYDELVLQLDEAKDDRAVLAAEIFALRSKLKPQRRRNRDTARKAGSAFERLVADYLAAHVDDRIDRKVKTGAKDRGDIAGVRIMGGGRMVLELKDTATYAGQLGSWHGEADTERGNDDAVASAVIHKRVKYGQAGQQWVTMTVDDLVALLTGSNPALQASDG